MSKQRLATIGFLVIFFLICLVAWKSRCNRNDPQDASQSLLNDYKLPLDTKSGDATAKIYGSLEMSNKAVNVNETEVIDFLDEQAEEEAKEEVRKWEFLTNVKRTDIIRNQRLEPSMEEIRNMSTHSLWDHLTKSSICTFFMTSEWPVERMRQCSNILKELENRLDFVESAIVIFDEEAIDPDPDVILAPNEWEDYMERMKTQGIGTIPDDLTAESLALGKLSCIISYRCQLLMHPLYYDNIKGNEVQLLKALVKSQENILSAQSETLLKSGEEQYGIAQGGEMSLSLKLVHSYWPTHYERLLQYIDNPVDFTRQLRVILDSTEASG